MIKRKELIICIISVAILILAITTNVFATNNVPDLNTLVGNNSNNTSENENFNQISNSTGNNTSNNTNTIATSNNTNNNTTNNTANKIPYTGVNYSVIVIIAVCGVSTIYAYKKIRDYNV